MNGFVIDCYLKNSIHKIFPNFPINSASNEQSVLEVIHFKNVTLVYSFALKRPKFMTISNFEILFTDYVVDHSLYQIFQNQEIGRISLQRIP